MRGINTHQQSGHSLVVKRYPSKLDMRVRFPLPAPLTLPKKHRSLNSMKTIIKSLILSAAFGTVTAYAEETNEISKECEKIAQLVKQQVASDKSAVLEIVDTEVSKNPKCASLIVVSAIQASNATNSQVGQIVQAAGTAAPGQLNSIVAAAIGAAPGASSAINAAAQNVPGANGAVSANGINPIFGPGGGQAGKATGANDGGNTQNSPGNSGFLPGSVGATANNPGEEVESEPIVTVTP